MKLFLMILLAILGVSVSIYWNNRDVSLVELAAGCAFILAYGQACLFTIHRYTEAKTQC